LQRSASSIATMRTRIASSLVAAALHAHALHATRRQLGRGVVSASLFHGDPRAHTPRGATRRQLGRGVVSASFFPGVARAANKFSGGKETNDVLSVVDGVRRKRLGNTDIAVSELALGTQRWGGSDFNSPDEELCHKFLDRGVLEGGINLIDTAEQYPIPSGPGKPEGATEEIIGRWIKKGSGRRDKLVIASKITGGRNIDKRSIREDCEGSLKRLGLDTLDVYLLHWPARYTPQANWGQSLEYDWDYGATFVPGAASFREIVGAMGELMKQGKIRGYGACNDNAVGLMGMWSAARELGVPGPICARRRGRQDGDVVAAAAPYAHHTQVCKTTTRSSTVASRKTASRRPRAQPSATPASSPTTCWREVCSRANMVSRPAMALLRRPLTIPTARAPPSPPVLHEGEWIRGAGA